MTEPECCAEKDAVEPSDDTEKPRRTSSPQATSKARDHCFTAARHLGQFGEAKARGWKNELIMTLKAIADPARRPDKFYYQAFPHSLLQEAHAVRRIRNAAGLCALSTVMVVAIRSRSMLSLAGVLDVATYWICSMILSLLVWRLSVSKARRLARDVHIWARTTQEDAQPWLHIKDDAAAIFSPWLPKGNTHLRAWSKKLKERIS